MQTLKHWTTFQGRPNSCIRPTNLRVTLSPRGDIYMNKIGWESLGKPEAVELMFDKPRVVIGLRAVAAWQENSFPVRDKKGSEGKIVHASPFFAHHAIRASRTMLFNQAHIDDEGVLSLPLEGLTAVTRGGR